MLKSVVCRVVTVRNLKMVSTRMIKATYSTTIADPSHILETPMPQTDESDHIYAPKLVKIVDEISNLTVLEVSELNKLLKKTLNISDTPMMAAVATPSTDTASGDDDAPVAKEQTEFTVRLNSFTADSKIKVIKAVKGLIPDMNLVKAKGFVESLPQIVKKDVTKEDADEALKILSEAGGSAVVE